MDLDDKVADDHAGQFSCSCTGYLSLAYFPLTIICWLVQLARTAVHIVGGWMQSCLRIAAVAGRAGNEIFRKSTENKNKFFQ